MFLEKGVLKICDKFTGEIPMPKCDFNKVASNFIEILVRHGCSAVSLLHIFRTLFPKNTSGRLLLKLFYCIFTDLSFRSNFSKLDLLFAYMILSHRLCTLLILLRPRSWGIHTGGKQLKCELNIKLGNCVDADSKQFLRCAIVNGISIYIS